jgi:hypothetical protein
MSSATRSGAGERDKHPASTRWVSIENSIRGNLTNDEEVLSPALIRYLPTYPINIGSRPRLGFKSFWTARCTIAGIEVRHAIRKGQWLTQENTPATPAE